MTRSSQKVLIVENEEEWQGIWLRHLKREGIEVIVASSLKDGEHLFESNSDIALVIMDGCLEGDHLDSPPLIQKMRQTFHGPIVAASGAPSLRRQLMMAGCSHEAPKDLVSVLALKILKGL